MSSTTKTIVFITGVRQGIGRHLLQTYLTRPNHTVIGTVRNPDTISELQSLPAATGSKPLIVSIENTSATDQTKALTLIKDNGIEHIDIFIANAGSIPPPKNLDSVMPEDLASAFAINASSAVLFFQTFKALLKKSSSPKWVSVSTFGGSVGFMPTINSFEAPAYGASKAALNWLTEAIHHSQEWMVVLCVHPGHVQTGPGNMFAKGIGMEKAPNTVEECTSNLMSLIDKATREEHGGKFIDNMSGGVLPW
ncbi:NAD(P)-binding protein [Aspergillus falconensis]